jgi:hypothetical protein
LELQRDNDRVPANVTAIASRVCCSSDTGNLLTVTISLTAALRSCVKTLAVWEQNLQVLLQHSAPLQYVSHFWSAFPGVFQSNGTYFLALGSEVS